MEIRLEKNNCNLFRKTRNFYSVTPTLKLSYSQCQDLPKFPLGEGGDSPNWKYSKCQYVPKFQFFGGGGGISETENTQSGKVCINFHGGVFWNWKYSKWQGLPKFPWGGYSETENTQSGKVCLNFHWGGGGYSETKNTQSGKVCLNFHGGGGILKLKILKVARSA